MLMIEPEDPFLLSTTNKHVHGHAMAKGLSDWSLNVQVRVQSQASPCGIYGGRSGTWRVVLRVLRFSPVSIITTAINKMSN
jgi:hypothetical protein